jgi:hypothetical protein
MAFDYGSEGSAIGGHSVNASASAEVPALKILIGNQVGKSLFYLLPRNCQSVSTEIFQRMSKPQATPVAIPPLGRTDSLYSAKGAP